jgi:hypothetical protein
MTPYYGIKEIPNAKFQVAKLGCRPCSKIGHDKCPRGHFKCMNNISVNDLVAKVKAMI